MSNNYTGVPEATLIKQRQQGVALISPIKSKVTAMIVKTPADYEAASDVLAQIRTAKGNWQSRINPIIEPIRGGLDLLYGLRKDILDPLEDLESQVKERMRAFKIDEARRIEAAAAEQRRIEDALAKEAEEKKQREEAAKTLPMKKKLADARAALEQKLAISKATSSPMQAVKSKTSTARKSKKWKLTDMGLLIHYIIEYPELSSLLQIDPVQMNAYFKLDTPEVGEWLGGLEVFEDIDIAGRR